VSFAVFDGQVSFPILAFICFSCDHQGASDLTHAALERTNNSDRNKGGHNEKTPRPCREVKAAGRNRLEAVVADRNSATEARLAGADYRRHQRQLQIIHLDHELQPNHRRRQT
jgi:hypothetical protein